MSVTIPEWLIGAAAGGPFVVGYVVGCVARGGSFVASALAMGYRRGRRGRA